MLLGASNRTSGKFFPQFGQGVTWSIDISIPIFIKVNENCQIEPEQAHYRYYLSETDRLNYPRAYKHPLKPLRNLRKHKSHKRGYPPSIASIATPNRYNKDCYITFSLDKTDAVTALM